VDETGSVGVLELIGIFVSGEAMAVESAVGTTLQG
jgi:hypothetical protein